MTRAYAYWLQFALAIALVFNAGCGDGSGGDDDDRDGSGGRDSGENDREDFIADTSGFEGLLTWTLGSRAGLYVWDLPKSEFIFERRGRLDGDEANARFPSEPALSRDGKTLVYTLEETFLITLAGEVIVRDLATGDEELYPSSGLGANHQRITGSPSISRDGRIVAVAERHFEWVTSEFGTFPEDETKSAIQIWDRTSGELTSLTDGSFKAFAPRLSADGSRVLFLSDELSPVDFYIANTSAPFEIERLTIFADEPGLKLGQSFSNAPGGISASDDLRYVAFVALNEDQTAEAAFILDTEAKTIERAIIRPIGVEIVGETSIVRLASIALSGDGSTLAYTVYFMDIVGETINAGRQILRASRLTPGETSVVDIDDEGVAAGLDPNGLALSVDGSQIAYSLRREELWVNLIDGSDPRQVIHEDQKRVGPDFGLSMSLSF